MSKRETYECDQWDDHPAIAGDKGAFGLGYLTVKGSTTTAATDQNVARGIAAAAGSSKGLSQAQIQAAMDHAAALTVSGVDSTTAAKQAVAAQTVHLTFLQLLARTIAHPIKTVRGDYHQSGMHGLPSHNNTLSSEFDQPSFFQGAPSAFGGGTPNSGGKPAWWESSLGDRSDWDR